MTGVRSAFRVIVAATLVGAGIVYFAAALGVVGSGADSKALGVVAAVVLLYAVLSIDPAWILSAGLVTTMFAAHWDLMGIHYPVPPHRILLGAGLLAVMLRLPPARDRPPIRLGGVHFVLAAAVAYALISAIVAGTIGQKPAQFALLDDYGVLPFLMFLVAPVAFATQRQQRILLGSLVGTGVYLGVTALLEQFNLYSLVWPGYIGNRLVGTHFGRARGPFVEAGANGLAIYACAIAALIAVVLWRRWPRLVAAGVALLAPVALLMTVTRSVWIAGTVASLVTLATTPELRRFLVPAAVAGTAAILLAFAAIPGLSKEAQGRKNDKSPVYERENTTAAGLRMLGARPLLGFGWEKADAEMEPYFRLNPNIPLKGARAGLHNIYLQYGVTLGLVGLAIWLLGLGLAVRSAFAGRAPPTVRPWQIGLKGVLVAWVIVGLSTPLAYLFSTVLVWTWAGVAGARPQLGGATTSRWSHGNPASTSFG